MNEFTTLQNVLLGSLTPIIIILFVVFIFIGFMVSVYKNNNDGGDKKSDNNDNNLKESKPKELQPTKDRDDIVKNR